MSRATAVQDRVRPADASRRPAFSAWALVPAVLQLAALAATANRYGYHPDELYFIAAGRHPAWGYPDQPALVPLLAAAMNHVDPGSLVVLRGPSAVAAALTTVLAACVARECGGRTGAQLVAAVCTAVSGFALAVGHNVSTTTFDMLGTTLLGLLATRALLRRDAWPLVAAGAVVGVGFEFKPQIGLVAVALIGGLLVAGPRWPLRSRQLWIGVVLALLLATPYLAWQARHGWPQAVVARNIAGDAEGGRAGFLPFQLVMVSPVLVPVWIVGLVGAWRDHRHALRAITVAYAALAAAYLIGDGKAYYLASLYPLLLGVGAVPVAAWLHRGRRRVRVGALVAAVAVSAAIGAVVALPLLPADRLQGSTTMALNPDIGQQVGWPRFVRTVDRVWRSIPASRRSRTAIFTAYYGEAGAVDLLGRPLGLPTAYSGHNAFGEWGPPRAAEHSVLLLGYTDPADARPFFIGCHVHARIDDGVGLDNDEQGLPVMLCRLADPWTRLWPDLRHDN